jgi:predicted RNA polymerase sigma factor
VGPLVAALTRRFGDLDIAEEAAAEAFARPPSSGGRPTACPWSQIEAK